MEKLSKLIAESKEDKEKKRKRRLSNELNIKEEDVLDPNNQEDEDSQQDDQKSTP